MVDPVVISEKQEAVKLKKEVGWSSSLRSRQIVGSQKVLCHDVEKEAPTNC